MTVRGFYHTADGDHVPISFGYDEEKRAFESGLKKLREHADRLHGYAKTMSGLGFKPPEPGRDFVTVDGFEYKADPHGRLFASRRDDKPLLTTLEKEQLSRHIEIALAIFNVHVCNINSRSSMNLCLYTDYKWKEDKWIPRV